MKIYPYKSGSMSAKELSDKLGVRRIKREGSRWRPKANTTVVNWGCGPDNWNPELDVCNVINNPQSVGVCSNKLHYFRTSSEGDQCPRLPQHSESRQEVLESLSGGDSVEWVARTVLTGHSGVGIALIKGDSPPEDVPQAPLYVRYKKKQDEFRVHVFQGAVVDVQRKARSTAVPDEDVNWQVRNHANGFIFARNEGAEVPEDVLEQSRLAVRKVGLDFGAVDVVFNRHEGLAYVLEINTAPGLTGATLDGYAARLGAML